MSSAAGRIRDSPETIMARANQSETGTPQRDLEGKVAIVTGAAGGIGRATALLLESRGAAGPCGSRSYRVAEFIPKMLLLVLAQDMAAKPVESGSQGTF